MNQPPLTVLQSGGRLHLSHSHHTGLPLIVRAWFDFPSCCCSLSVFYSRSSSRASSGELSRQSWGSMRGLSLSHGPHILGGSGGGAAMQSPSGSLGRVSGGADLMAAAAAGKCCSLHGSSGSSRPRSGQRPISTATVPSPGAAAPAAAVGVASSPSAVAAAAASAGGGSSQLAA
jgi:hypothetical protein